MTTWCPAGVVTRPRSRYLLLMPMPLPLLLLMPLLLLLMPLLLLLLRGSLPRCGSVPLNAGAANALDSRRET